MPDPLIHYCDYLHVLSELKFPVLAWKPNIRRTLAQPQKTRRDCGSDSMSSTLFSRNHLMVVACYCNRERVTIALVDDEEEKKMHHL